jgi:SAM-dependent methyltransferase
MAARVTAPEARMARRTPSARYARGSNPDSLADSISEYRGAATRVPRIVIGARLGRVNPDSPWAVASSPQLYDSIGLLYRKPDARIAAQIRQALGSAETICNIGAGAGAYEPTDRIVVPVEPSPIMASQRSNGAVRAVAEALPFTDNAFEIVTAFLTVHHWQDADKGLAELRRVAPRRIVLSFDLELHSSFWLVQEYLPEIASLKSRVPQAEATAGELGASRIETVWVPHDCTDGFLAAYWRRPDSYLDPGVRACISALAQLKPSIVERGIGQLRRDLADGSWYERHRDACRTRKAHLHVR